MTRKNHPLCNKASSIASVVWLMFHDLYETKVVNDIHNVSTMQPTSLLLMFINV